MVKKKSEKDLGRPSVMTDKTISKLEEAFRIGATDIEACLHAGICRASLYKYQSENPEFTDRKEMLKDTLLLASKQVVAKGITKGNQQDAKWYLERKQKNEFSLRSELTGADGKDLPAPTFNIQPVKVKDDE